MTVRSQSPRASVASMTVRSASPRAPVASTRLRSASRVSFWFFCLCVAVLVAGCHGKDLPEYGSVPPFRMTDQDGKPLTSDALRGKVWAAAFVFTRCPSACPRVTRAMRGVQLDAKARHVELRLVSFTIDPEYDTKEVLARYATEYGADTSTWSFVTGDPKGIQRTAEQGFKIAAEGTADPSKPDFGISHGTQLVLVDPSSKIRGYYATSDAEALRRIVSDAERLSLH